MNGDDDDDDDGDECDIDGNILCGIFRHDCYHYNGSNAIINHLNNDFCFVGVIFILFLFYHSV